MNETQIAADSSTPDVGAPEGLTAEQTREFFEKGPESVNLEPTPQPDAATATEPQTETSEQPAEPEKKQRLTDYNALHAERQERRKAEAALAEAREKAARMEGAFQAFLEQQRAAQQPEPDISADPVAYFKAQNERLAREVEALKESDAQRAEAAKYQGVEQQIISHYRNAAEDFSAQTPEFVDAYGNWSNGMVAELEAYGYPKAEAVQRAQNIEMQIVSKALHDGVNPAERIFSAAKTRGWAKQPAKSAPNLTVVQSGQKAQGAGSTSSGTGGALTLESLAAMSPEERAKNWSRAFG